MARVVGQSIPAELYQQYKYKMMPALPSGFYYYLTDYQYGYAAIVRTKIPWELPTRRGIFYPDVSKAEEYNRLAFSRSCSILALAPRTGTVSPPESGPRSREYWYDHTPDTFFIWTNYFHQQTLVFTKAYRRPPWGITDYFYVCDTENSRIVQRHCNDWGFMNKIGSWDGAPGQFKLPWFITDNGRYVYVSDPINYRIAVLGRNNLNWITSFDTYDNDKKDIGIISGLASEDTTLFMATADAGGVLLINANTRKSIGSFIARGQYDSAEMLIVGVAIDHDYIYVSDINNHNIKIFRRSDYKFIKSLGSLGSGTNKFNNPYGLAVDMDYLYVADSGNNRIVKLTKPGLVWTKTAGPGQDVEISFNDCSDVDISGDYLLVSDTGNSRICRLLASTLALDSAFGSYGEGDDNFERPIGICARAQVFK